MRSIHHVRLTRRAVIAAATLVAAWSTALPTTSVAHADSSSVYGQCSVDYLVGDPGPQTSCSFNSRDGSPYTIVFAIAAPDALQSVVSEGQDTVTVTDDPNPPQPNSPDCVTSQTFSPGVSTMSTRPGCWYLLTDDRIGSVALATTATTPGSLMPMPVCVFPIRCIG